MKHTQYRCRNCANKCEIIISHKETEELLDWSLCPFDSDRKANFIRVAFSDIYDD